ncbi:MAG: DNA repair protein Rad50 [Lachnospiraceae bacterium]|nr:DNA repair protein Rad50 [Lachnospiraceae bacterium]
MIIMDVKLNHVYGFDDFHINFSYPRKLVASLLGNESLEGRERFRFKKAVILMGTNATGKTSFGRALLKIFKAVKEANEAILRELNEGDAASEFSVDFVNQGYTLHRLTGVVEKENVSFRYYTASIDEMDSYEMAAEKLEDHTSEVGEDFKLLKKSVGELEYRFAYPEIEAAIELNDVKRPALLKTLRAVIGTLDPTLTDVSIAKELKDSFIIRRRGQEIIIQEGKVLNRELLSSGTAEGIDVAVFLASMLSEKNCFYYCDEHFSYIQSDIEKRIFGLMVEKLGRNEQLIFTTHNTDMLNLNLPKHAFAFMKKEIYDDKYITSVTFASDLLKRNTDSVKCAMENDVFGSIPDDSLLDELEELVDGE